MNSSTFRYYHLKISAKRLPGKGFKIDPLAVVFAGGPGKWEEVGRTEKRLNDWNPKFASSIAFPGDNDTQRRQQIRVDFFNRQMSEKYFLGTCETNLYSLIATEGREVEFELSTPQPVSGSPRVFLAALEGYVGESGNVSISFQLMQTNYYGVAMTMFYEISRAAGQKWHPVFKSDNIKIDEQGWGQFPLVKLSQRDLSMDEEATGLLFSLYRYKVLGPRRLLGQFQTSVKDLAKCSEGDFLVFNGNLKEDIVRADVQVVYSKKQGTEYDFGLKLVNVQWKNATLLTPEQK